MKEETRQAVAMKKILDKRGAREYKKMKEKETIKSNKTDTTAAGEDPAAGQQEKTFNQVAYMNEYNRNNYDRVNLTMPKGKKAIVKERAAGLKKSVNEYINDLINADLEQKEAGGE